MNGAVVFVMMVPNLARSGEVPLHCSKKIPSIKDDVCVFIVLCRIGQQWGDQVQKSLKFQSPLSVKSIFNFTKSS